jgi:methionyl-tRNA formyltransferase
MRGKPSAVKALAAARGIRVLQPAGLKSDAERAAILAVPIDVLVVAAYGLILPRPILDWPRHGCINIHASLLPRWRGAAPIQRALLAGDGETGITLMQMDEGLDTGPIVARYPTPVAPRETAGSLHDKLAAIAGRAITEALARLQNDGRLPAKPQGEQGATYAAKLDRVEAVIDWRASAESIDRSVRAFNPAPGARTSFEGVVLKIWEGTPLSECLGIPGLIARADEHGVVIACGEGGLSVSRLQRAGGKPMSAAAFLAGHALAPGMRFGEPNN